VRRIKPKQITSALPYSICLEVMQMDINWYPGHMVKAKKEILNNIKLVDIAVILLDARAPFSCRNPELEEITRHKKVIIILNKADLMSAAALKEYKAVFKKEGYRVEAMDSTSGKGTKEVIGAIRNAFKEKEQQLLNKGRRVRAARVMVLGVPNVGKSTFLNCLVGKKMAKTGAKPGITRGKQWVRVREDIEFMDTPGLMWPKIENEEQGYKLALLDIIGENAYEEYEIALFLVNLLKEKAPQVLRGRFKLDDLEKSNSKLIEVIAYHRGYLNRGGEIDINKTSRMLLNEFRRGNLGPIKID